LPARNTEREKREIEIRPGEDDPLPPGRFLYISYASNSDREVRRRKAAQKPDRLFYSPLHTRIEFQTYAKKALRIAAHATHCGCKNLTLPVARTIIPAIVSTDFIDGS
jgi:hypothetical protein